MYIIIVCLDPFSKHLSSELFFSNKLVLQCNILIELFVFIANIWGVKNTKRVSGKLPQGKIVPWLGLGFG